MEHLTKLFKALSDRNRLRIMAALMVKEELCACQITELLGVAGATASRHLALLQAAALITSRKEGRWVHFRLCPPTEPTSGLLEWTKTQLTDDLGAARDMDQLLRILKRSPEDVCRGQRGESCCPPPKAP